MSLVGSVSKKEDTWSSWMLAVRGCFLDMQPVHGRRLLHSEGDPMLEVECSVFSTVTSYCCLSIFVL